MFALNGLLVAERNTLKKEIISKWSYEIADAMLEARNEIESDDGIVAIKKRKYVRKN